MDLDIFAQGGYGGGGINLEGGTITGSLLLFGNPSQPLEAVPKQYVDGLFSHLSSAGFSSGVLPVGRLPAFGGDFTSEAGSNHIQLKENGITPAGYPKVTVNGKGFITKGSNLVNSDLPNGISWEKVVGNKPNTLAGYGITDAVPLTGGTIQGVLKSSGIISDNRAIVNKEYIDSQSVSGGLKTGDVVRKASNITPDGMLRTNGGQLRKDDYPDLYNVIGDRYNTNQVAGSGQPWRQQYEINTEQTGDITGWSLYGTLPATFCHHQAVVTKNRIYVLGSYTGTSSATVYTAPIKDDGLIGTWTTGTALPVALSHSQAVVTNNRLYVIGGYSGSSQQSNVYTAAINADGTLGAWASGPTLPVGTSHSHTVKTSTKIYLIGGAISGGQTANIYSALINTDGTISSWVLDGTLPEAFNNGQLITIKNKVYILNSVKGVVYTYIYESNIDNNGNLGTWTVSETFPIGLYASNVYVSQKYVYVIGGYDGSNYLSSVYKCPINGDGTLGEWSLGSSFPTTITRSQVIATKNRIYMIGGATAGSTYTANIYSAPIDGGLNDYSQYYKDAIDNYLEPGSGRPWQQQYQINDQQSSDITGWTASAALPISVGISQAVVTKNRVYIIGGRSGASNVSSVYMAPINSDGTLGTWLLQTEFPILICNHSTVIVKNRIYVFGGSNGTTYLSSVYTALINADGTLGTWTLGNPLPGTLGNSQAIVTKNRVYILGGYTGSAYVSTGYSAIINIDGTLGPWVSFTSGTATALCNTQIVITKNRIYSIGGHNGTAAVSSVYTSLLNSDGQIIGWSAGTSLPIALYGSQVVVTKNRVYLIGGYTGSAYTTTTYYATINADGTLGTWVASSSILTGHHFASVITTSSKVYLLGGWTGGTTTLANVQVASFTGGKNDYSQHYLGDDNNYVMPGSGRPWEQQYQVNTQNNPEISSWELVGNLPSAIPRGQYIVTKNKIYILGGAYTGTTHKNYYAIINEDGTLGEWIQDDTIMPFKASDGVALVFKNKVYLFNGYNGTSYDVPVYYSNIDSSGNLSNWISCPALPATTSANSEIFFTKNRVYVIGGWNGSNVSSAIYTSVVNSDGILGEWTLSGNLPIALGYSSSFITKNRIYICGGYGGSGVGYVSTVYTAGINSDGKITEWTTGPSLPTNWGRSEAFIYKDKVYLIGGTTQGTIFSNTIYVGTINQDGFVTGWSTGTSLPITLAHANFICVKNHLYILGGQTSSRVFISSIYSANIIGGLNDYSPYYDGTIEPYGLVDMNEYFYLPDFTSSELEQSYSFIKI